MKLFRIFFKNIGDAFKSIFRNINLSMASLTCIMITLILVGVSIIFSYNINNFTREIEKDLTIVIFLKRDVTEENIKNVEYFLKSINNIKSVTFESKNDIKNQMKNKSEVFESIMSEWTDETNPLQDTFLVKVKNVELIGETADAIESLEQVDLVKYGEGMVEELVSIFNNVKKITYAVVGGLVIVTAFLISNTIKVTILNRKRQIEIMRLVGASNTYIKIPFFFEGLFLGLIGSILPIFLCCYGYIYLYSKFNGKLFTDIIKLISPDAIIFNVIFIILTIGIFVGGFGSYRAVRRYLKI